MKLIIWLWFTILLLLPCGITLGPGEDTGGNGGKAAKVTSLGMDLTVTMG